MPGEKFDYGTPAFNLKIRITPGDGSLRSSDNSLIPEADYKKYVAYATGLLSGERHVTEKGYIRSGHMENLSENRTATLELANNGASLNDIVNMKNELAVVIYYDSHVLERYDFIRINKNGLFIDSPYYVP